jgi:putative membrane protein
MIQSRSARRAAALGAAAACVFLGAGRAAAQDDAPAPQEPPAPQQPQQQPAPQEAPVTPTTPEQPAPNAAAARRQQNGTQAAHDAAALSAADRAFLRNAAHSNVAEVLTGQLALKKAASASVKQLAQMLIQEHGQANAQLKQVAAQHATNLPNQPNPEQKAMYNRLARLSGAAFDRAYLSAQIRSHLKSVALYRSQIRNGKDEHAIGYARATLPRIEGHTGMIVQVAEGVGVRAPQQARAFRRPAPTQDKMRMRNNRGVGGNSGNTMRHPE